jgi:hypothetical protein
MQKAIAGGVVFLMLVSGAPALDRSSDRFDLRKIVKRFTQSIRSLDELITLPKP